MKFSRRKFLQAAGSLTTGMAIAGENEDLPSITGNQKNSLGRKNVVIFTTDDNDADSLGCYGCPLQGVTPHLDNLATQGVRVEHAHTSTSTCQGSRLSLMTGLYPQTSGATGHSDPIGEGISTLALELKNAGYTTVLVQKDPNYRPDEAFQWDRRGLVSYRWVKNQKPGYFPGWGSPEGFYNLTTELISDAKSDSKPFFFHLNTTDPHRPWPGSVDEIPFLENWQRNYKDRKILPLEPFPHLYSPWEIPVPGYLPDLPGVRIDVSQYYSALHRADMAVGGVLRALEEAGELDNTIFIYLGDQGASLPTSKQNLYRYSTQIPLIIRWPEVTTPGDVIQDTMVSIVDLMPTILHGLGLSRVANLDGQSFYKRIESGSGGIRQRVYTSYNYAQPGEQVFPMRAVQTREHLYIYNAWPGERLIYPSESIQYDGLIEPLTGLAWKSMKEAAVEDPQLSGRVEFIRSRQAEEFYDLTQDPYCLNNQIATGAFAKEVAEMRELLETQMIVSNDPLIAKFNGTGNIPSSWLTLG